MKGMNIPENRYLRKKIYKSQSQMKSSNVPVGLIMCRHILQLRLLPDLYVNTFLTWA